MRTEEDIPKATFVTEYVGEMISSEVAERRGMRYDRSRVSYLMDLDVEGRDNRYWSVFHTLFLFSLHFLCLIEDHLCFTLSIDAMIQGNTSRFFNHSCLPNLVIYYVSANDTVDEGKNNSDKVVFVLCL